MDDAQMNSPEEEDEEIIALRRKNSRRQRQQLRFAEEEEEEEKEDDQSQKSPTNLYLQDEHLDFYQLLIHHFNYQAQIYYDYNNYIIERSMIMIILPRMIYPMNYLLKYHLSINIIQ